MNSRSTTVLFPDHTNTTISTTTAMDLNPAKRKANDDLNPLLIAAKRSKKEVSSVPSSQSPCVTTMIILGSRQNHQARQINGNVMSILTY